MCIHRHEGPWNDPNGPYYGGLQMDLQFQRAYGAYLLRTKGTADNWTPVEQVAVAERAYKERGFSPVAEHGPGLRPALTRAHPRPGQSCQGRSP